MITTLRSILPLVLVIATGCGQSANVGLPGNPNPSPGVSSGISIASVSPPSVTAGSPDLTIAIDGEKFQARNGFNGTLVGWSTQANDLHCCTTWLATNFVSTTQLTAVIPTGLLQNSGKGYIYVEIGDVMGISDGVSYPKSNVVKFDVLP